MARGERTQKKKGGFLVNEMEESIETKRDSCLVNELDEAIEKKQGPCLLDELHCVEPTENVEERKHGDTKSAVTEERWIGSYSSVHRILLVGEGDFSFSASLAMAFGSASNMIATSFDSVEVSRANYRSATTNIKNLTSRGCRVLHGIGVKQMANGPQLKGMIFDSVIFNFPCSGFFKNGSLKYQIRGLRRLMSLFFKNAKEMISETGEIHITEEINAFNSECNIQELASCHQLVLKEAVHFNSLDHPGYSTKHGLGSNNTPIKTYKFGHKNASIRRNRKNKNNAKLHSQKPIRNFGEKEPELCNLPAEEERGKNRIHDGALIPQSCLDRFSNSISLSTKTLHDHNDKEFEECGDYQSSSTTSGSLQKEVFFTYPSFLFSKAPKALGSSKQDFGTLIKNNGFVEGKNAGACLPKELHSMEQIEKRKGFIVNKLESKENKQDSCLVNELDGPVEKKQGACLLDEFRHTNVSTKTEGKKKNSEPIGKKQNSRWVKKVNSGKFVENIGGKGQEVLTGVVAEEERGGITGCDSVLIPQIRCGETVSSEKCAENLGAKEQEFVMVVAEEERGRNGRGDSCVLIPQTRWVKKVRLKKFVENVGAKGQEAVVRLVAEQEIGGNKGCGSLLISQMHCVEKVPSEKCGENVGAGQQIVVGVVAEEERGNNSNGVNVLIPQTHWMKRVHSGKRVENAGAKGQDVIMGLVAEERRDKRGLDSPLIPQAWWVEKVHAEKCVENVGAKVQEVIKGAVAEDRESNRGRNSALIPQARWTEKVHAKMCVENFQAKGREVVMGVVEEEKRGNNGSNLCVLIPQTRCMEKIHSKKRVENARAKGQEFVAGVVAEEEKGSDEGCNSVLIPQARRVEKELSEKCVENVVANGHEAIKGVVAEEERGINRGRDSVLIPQTPFICNLSKTDKFGVKTASTKRNGKKKSSEPIANKQNACWVKKKHYKKCFVNVGTRGQEAAMGVVAKEEAGSNRGRNDVKITHSCLDSFENSTTNTSYIQSEKEYPEWQDHISNLSRISAGTLHDQNDTRCEEFQDYPSNSSTSILHDQNDIKFEECQDYESILSTSGSQEQEELTAAASSLYCEDPNVHGTSLQNLEVSVLQASVDNTKFMEEDIKDACLLGKRHTNEPNKKKQEGCSLFQKHSEEPTEKKQDICLLENPHSEESLENQHGASLPEAFHSNGPIENFEGEQVDSKGMLAEERWINHYSSSQKILLVGEGDFSFATCLAKAFGSGTNMIATSLDSEEFLWDHYLSAIINIKNLTSCGCRVLHGVDATKMADNELLKGMKFDRIVFNFPWAGFFKIELRYLQLWQHQHLVSLFLENAKKMINETGEIHITHKTNGFHRDWNIVELATCHGLRLIEAVNFNCSDYPGYNTKYGFGGDNNFNCNPSKTYKFGLNNPKSASDKMKKKKKEKDFRLQPDDLFFLAQQPDGLSWSFNRTMTEYSHVLPPYFDCSPSGVFQPLASPPYLDYSNDVFQPMASPPYLDCTHLGVSQPLASSSYLDCSLSGGFQPMASPPYLDCSLLGVSQPTASSPYLDCSQPGRFQPMDSQPHQDCSRLFQPMASSPYPDCSHPGVSEPIAPFTGVSGPIASFSDGVINSNHPYSSNWSP